MLLRSCVLAASLAALSAAAVFAGPPWISIEMPANPHHPSTRDAAFMIRAYHHSSAIDVPVEGVAHGVVDGRRVRLPLDIRATSMAGVFAVHTPLPKNGAWVLAVTLTESASARATALVSVDARGRIVAVDVPADRRDGWSVPRTVTTGDIDAALRAVNADADEPLAAAMEPSRPVLTAALVMLPMLLLGGLAARRRAHA